MIARTLPALVGLLLAGAAGAQIPTPPISIDDRVTGVPPASGELSARERAVPAQLTPRQRFQYRRIFMDIAAGRSTAASNALAAMGSGPLHAAAEAQILVALGPNAGRARLSDWLAANPNAPQARQLADIARRAGANDVPALVSTRRLVPVSFTPPLGPRSVRGESREDQAFSGQVRQLMAGKRVAEVPALLDRMGPSVSSPVLAEWAQKAAWDAYLDLNDDLAAEIAARAARGGGEWAALGSWVAGLANFRQGRCEEASAAFENVPRQFAGADLAAKGAYWAARAHLRCGRPEKYSQLLRVAMARDPHGLYGLLAARTLGMTPRIDWSEPDFIQADWTTLSQLPGARRAAALVEVGEVGLADRELRHLAATAPTQYYEPILRLANRLSLPATQFWLAHNAPEGMTPPMSARLPAPEWQPFNGWRVDRNLVFAHAMQESRFITTARSPVGAQGLMQVMPGTARDLSRHLDMPHNQEMLADPTFNVEYGQSYLEMLRDSQHTQGLLPKVIAAYNAGPGSVMRWNNGGVRDNNDVLLWMESIPFRETRHYVGVVMRNYWLYEARDRAERGLPPMQADERSSLAAVAQNLWPRFPGLAGVPAVPFPGAPTHQR
jgi:soluble lytic murein transglycosylase